ncbi:choice-of-anchor J domain-containing protein, partial [Neptunitalea chrysea]|uniref:choice-of-anchor J domain-containing protein n=1 Tax=Neptunitalea chrysea TaxID=1647581 RepID=UPI002493A5E6
MKRNLLLICISLITCFTYGQVINEPANWPSTSWTISGSYYVTTGVFEGNPLITANFAYDDGVVATPTEIAAESPVIDLTPAHVAGEDLIYFTGDYVYNYAGSDELIIQYYNAQTGSWVNWDAPINSDTTSPPTDNYCSGTHENYLSSPLNIANFTPTQLSNFQYRIYFNDNNSFAKGFCFSNPAIHSEALPPCDAPTDVTINTLAYTSVIFSWTPGGSENQWEVFVVPTGTSVSGSGDMTNTYTNYEYNGLNPNTTYDIYIRSICSSYNSIYTGPITFTTLDNTPQPPTGVSCSTGSGTYVFIEEFDASSDWTGDINSGSASWEIPDDSGSTGTGPSAAYSGSSFMNFEASGANTTGSIVSPIIDLTDATEAVELSFYMHAYGAGMGTFEVGIGTSVSGPFTNVFTWTGQYQTSSSEDWLPVGIDLTAYAGQTIYIEFKQIPTGNPYGDLSIDLMRVEACGTFCFIPSNVTVSDITTSTIDLDWIPNSGESEWEYVIQPAGTGTPTTGTEVISNSLDDIGTLTADTDYEVYVRAKCDTDFYSNWTSPVTFTTPIQTDYTVDCSAGSTNVTYCYENNDTTTFTFTAENGVSNLELVFNSGGVQNGADMIMITDYDGSLLYLGYGSSGDLTGLTASSTGTSMSVQIISNNTVNCSSSSSIDSWDFDVTCGDCMSAPQVDYTMVSDCANGPQFMINAEITDMAGASSVVLSDNASGIPLTVYNTGIYILGPYPNTTDVVITATNNDIAGCASYSDAITQTNCLPITAIACNEIEAGDDQTIDCGTSDVQLSASYIVSGSDTNQYELSSISCDPDTTPGTPSQITNDDVYSGLIDIGFNFCFFGNTYSQLVIGANGVISFNTTYANSFCPWGFNASVPDPGLPLNAIFGVFHDIDPSQCGTIEYALSGTAPNRAFIVTYNVCQFNCTNLTSNTQIVLHETTNAIEINIIDKPTCTAWNSGVAVAGIQNSDGTIGYTPQGRNTGAWTATNEYWRYVPSGPSNYTFEWLEGSTVLATDSPYITVNPLSTTTYTAQISYAACDGTTATFSDDVTVAVNNAVDPDEFTTENAIELVPVAIDNIGSAIYPYNYNGYTLEPQEPVASCFSSGINQTTWFEFTAPASGEVRINTSQPSGITAIEMAVYETETTSCTNLTTAGNEIACTATETYLEFSGASSLTPGATYLIQVNQGTTGADNFNIVVTNLACSPLSYDSATIEPDCTNNQFYVKVLITGLGNGMYSQLTDGTNTWDVYMPGTFYAGPYTNGSTANLTLTHGLNTDCDIDLGDFTYTCPTICSPVTYNTTTVTDDCTNSQFYVAIDITDIGNGTPYITDGTNTWNITTTGTMQVGPFSNSAPVNLTITHGSDSSCDMYVGSFASTCCIPATYTTPTIVEDCSNNHFYLSIEITDLGNGSPEIYGIFGDITAIQNTGTLLLGPYASGYNVTDSFYNGCETIDLSSYTYTCPPPTCTATTYSVASVYSDCTNNQYYVNVNITDLGDGTPYITDGTNTWNITSLGTTTAGPFTEGSTTNLILKHGVYSNCDIDLGSFTASCQTVCSPASYASATVNADCANTQFYIDVDITDLGNGTPSITDGTNSWLVTTTGTMQVGPFADASTVALTLEHGTDTTCDVDMGTYTYTCPFVCSPVIYNTAVVTDDCANDLFYVNVDITNLGNGTPAITDGTNTWPITATGVTAAGPFADTDTVSLTIVHGIDATCNSSLGDFISGCCIAPSYSAASVVPYCDNSQFYVDIIITDLGNGTPTITDGTNTWAVNATGTMQIGPFASDSTINLTLEHGNSTTCNVDMGSFTYTCPFVCNPANYGVTSISADCSALEFYVNVNITALGNGSPSITDGTNTWPVTATGTMQVGPFADASSVNLTLEHGTDATCDVDMGTYTYTCPTTCSSATYDSATVSADCANSRFFVLVNITDLGNGIPYITDGTNTWPVTTTGSNVVGPFA